MPEDFIFPEDPRSKLMYLTRFIIEMLCGTAIFCAIAAGHLPLQGKNIAVLEKLTRNRIIGIVFAIPALIACIPHAQIVAPGILQSPVLLWTLALLIPVLCYFYIDYYAARAVAGVTIILSYDLIHYAYDWKFPCAGIITVMAWISGFAAIWVSGKPCSLRDSFRLAAKNRKYAWTVTAVMVLFALTYIYSAVAGLTRIR